jgi:endoglucanase Acf2
MRKQKKRSKVRLLVENLETRLLLSSTPFTAEGQPWEILPHGPSAVEAENFDYGGEGVAYHSTYAMNPGHAYRPNEGIGIEGPNANTGGTYNVGYFHAGAWMNYTIRVDQAGTYVVNLHASSAVTNGGTGHVRIGDVTSAPITMSNTGGWGRYQDFTTTLTLAAGTQVMTVYEDTGEYNLDYIGLTPQAEANLPEQAYAPAGNNSTALQRGVPPLLPAFGAAKIEAEYYDFGGQAPGTDGVQSAGYYWLDQHQYHANYPHTSIPFRPDDWVDEANRGTGIVTNNWKGGDWTQYSVLAATNVTPVNPAATQPSYLPTSPSLQYQLLVTYSNSGTQTANFTISSTYTDPSTGVLTLTPVGTLTLAPTGSIYTYSTAWTSITLPVTGLNTLRFTDTDAAGTNSHVDIDYFRLVNSRTRGNNGQPWDVTPTGSTTHIAADNFDVAPDGYAYPPGTVPVVAPTGDSGGGNDVQSFTAGDALTYTLMAELTSKDNLRLRVQNTGSTAAVLQVSFDGGAAFGALDSNNHPPSPVIFTFNVPVAGGYQTLTTATNVSALPQTTNPWVEIPWGPQEMQVKVLSGTVNFHWAELATITSTAVIKPDPNGLGSYAAEPPNAVLNANGDHLFTIVYNTHYKWINPPPNATIKTNDWWTNMLVSNFAGDMYAFPQKINDSSAGVGVSGFAGVGTDAAGSAIRGTGQESLVVGALNTTFKDDGLLDYGDWTLHYRMEGTTTGSIDVTAGRGLPYTWFEFSGINPKLTMHRGDDANQNPYTAYDANGNVLGTVFTLDHFRLDTGGQPLAVFAPTGTTFALSGNVYTVTFAPGAQQYLVVAVLPDNTNATLDTFYQYAYAIPRQVGSTPSSKYTWDVYNAASGQITTRWNLNNVAIDPAPPAASQAAHGNYATIQGWLPIYYSSGASGLSLLNGSSGQPLFYPSLNGYIKVAAGTSFVVSEATNGINFELALPQLINAPTFTYDPSDPEHTTVSTEFDPVQMRAFLQTFIQQHTDNVQSAQQGTIILTYGNDTYWGAKPLQEYAEYALIAKQIGDTTDYNILLSNLRTFMTDWFTYDPTHDTTSHFFAYYPGSHALIGFSASYGSEDFTDNHFHYGYFTSAAGVLALLDPAWGAQYGAMAKMVAMQYANWLHPGDPPDVNDPNAISLPFLRTFEPWLGHSYAGGTGSSGGNNQESSSEAIQSWLGLVLLGQALNDPGMTSAGIMGYTIESRAVQQQWFNNEPGSNNPDGTAFPSTFHDSQGNPYSNVGIDFDGSKSHATYFGTNPEYILGIQALPIWPDLDYLGRNRPAAAAATQNLLANRSVYYNGPYNTFASFEGPGGHGGTDWLNIALGFQATYDPQATANEYGRMLAQHTSATTVGTTGLYYYEDHSYQTYGNRDWLYHLSLPLGGVYTHGSDGTTMANTRTYMVFNPATTMQTVQVFDSAGNVIDSFTAQPGFNVVTRSTNGGHAPPIITMGPDSNPPVVTGTAAALSVLATNEQQNESSLTYTWAMSSGPAGAQPIFSANGTNDAKNTAVTFNVSGAYQFVVTVTDPNGLNTHSIVAVTVVQTLTTLMVTPNSATVFINGSQQFSASGIDQFGVQVSNAAVSWAVTSGGGSITTAGLYHAPGSPGSAVVTASSGDTRGTADVTIVLQLPAPTGLIAVPANNYTEVDLSWMAPSGDVTGYNVYRGTSPGNESTTPLNSAPITDTSYRDTTVAPSTTYFYIVKAFNNGGLSGPSNEANATTAIDLALFHPATASSVENGGTPAAYAVDGDSTTRWSSQFSDPQWIYVDLGSTYNISEVKLNWEHAAGRDYQIQVSGDATNWTAILTVTGNTTSGWHDYPGLSGSGRYVRMYGTARTTQYGYSLYDYNVYGNAAPSVPMGEQSLGMAVTDVTSTGTNAGIMPLNFAVWSTTADGLPGSEPASISAFVPASATADDDQSVPTPSQGLEAFDDPLASRWFADVVWHPSQSRLREAGTPASKTALLDEQRAGADQVSEPDPLVGG